jgi:hypothetical protein
MKVFVLEYLGKKCVSPKCTEVADWIVNVFSSEEHNHSDKMVVYSKEMTQEELDSLPEFEGY